jgi:hypothetical protein
MVNNKTTEVTEMRKTRHELEQEAKAQCSACKCDCKVKNIIGKCRGFERKEGV